MSTSKKLVVILGGGVVGLHAAVELLEAGYAVKIIAKHLPGDLDVRYPSQQAAATWASDEEEVDEETKRWYEEGYQLWGDMADGLKEEYKEAGVTRRTCFRYWENPQPGLAGFNGLASALWHRDSVSSFSVLSSESLPAGVKFGTTFTSFCVNAPKYLDYLKNRVVSQGGTITRATLPLNRGLAAALEASEKAFGDTQKDEVYAYVNALGLGAKELLGDENVFPLKSHSIHVKGEAEKIADRIDNNGIYYAIPRVGSGFTVLGGFMDPGNWNETLDPELLAKILRLCKKLIPECLDDNGEFTVLGEYVGLRPHRKGGARVEVDLVESTSGRDIPVVHSYGHGAGGFFKAIGSARKVVRLVDGLDAKQPIPVVL